MCSKKKQRHKEINPSSTSCIFFWYVFLDVYQQKKQKHRIIQNTKNIFALKFFILAFHFIFLLLWYCFFSYQFLYLHLSMYYLCRDIPMYIPIQSLFSICLIALMLIQSNQKGFESHSLLLIFHTVVSFVFIHNISVLIYSPQLRNTDMNFYCIVRIVPPTIRTRNQS